MRKIVLADNDIIHKLACCDLLTELLQWLDVPPTEIWVLPSMPHMLRRKLKSDARAVAALENFLKSVALIPDADITTLEQFPELDVGERQMLAVLLNTPEVEQLITGDKRALKLMGTICANDAAINARLADAKVDCLESIMLGLIEQLGFSVVNAKVVAGRPSDGVLSMSFGAQRNKAHALGALNSYLDAVRVDAPFVATP